LLAVSDGNVHIRLEGDAGLDLDLLKSIRDRVRVPLVLHGGTGIAADALRQAITLGVAKVNYGTYLKQRYVQAVRAALAKDVADPHRMLGIGGTEDVLVAGRIAVRDAVLERIELLGCCGKAGDS
jgi:fructose/tagatose bisphosphate aldolase